MVLLMSSGKEEEAHTFIWTIENFSCSIEDQWYRSERFGVNISKSMRYFSLKRNESNNGERLSFQWSEAESSFWIQNITNVEIYLLASDGSVFVCKQRKEVRNDKNSGDIHNVFVSKLKEYLSGDNLTVVFVLVKSDGILLESERIFARTRIGLQYVSFVWSIENCSSLQPFEERVFNLKEADKPGEVCKFELRLDDQDSLIICTKQVEYLKKLRVSILDSTGRIVDFSEYQAQEKKVNGFVWLLKFSSETMRNILTNRKLYLPGDVLSLRFEGFFHGKILHQYIEGDSQVPFLNCSNGEPFLANSDSGERRSFLNNSNTLKSDVRGSALASINGDFRTMFEQHMMSDYTLHTQTKSYPVHKNVLCARSSVLHAMLTSEMKEGLSDTMDILDVDDDTLHKFLLFLYTDEFDRDMNWEEASKLYSIAHKYAVLSLRDRCGCLLKCSLSTTNACSVLFLSDLHQDVDLKNSVLNFFWKHSSDIIKTEEWTKLESENGTLALETYRELLLKKRSN